MRIRPSSVGAWATAYLVAATYGFSPQQREHLERYATKPDRGNTFGRAIIEGRTVHIPDVVADPEWNRPEQPAATGVRAAVSVPLLREGVIVGALTVIRTEPRAFSQKQIELLETFADQAVIAIENTRLFEAEQASKRELQESLEYQTATGEVLNIISRSPTNIQPVFDTIVENVVQLGDGVSGFVYRFDGDLIHLVAHDKRVTPEALQIFKNVYPLKPSRTSVIAQAILDRAIVHVRDFESDDGVAQATASRTMAQAVGHRSLLAVPMLRDGRPIGAIAVGRPQLNGAARPFSDRDIDLLRTFADQAVIAIENTRLFEEVQARTRELSESLEYQTATSEVLNVISRSPTDIQPVLDAVGQNAARLCDADNAVIYRLERDHLRQVASYGQLATTSHPPEGNRIDRQTVSGRAAFERQTVHIRDLSTEDSEFPQGSAHARRDGHRTTLATPLLREGVPLGVILIRRMEVRPFSDRQIKLLETFADQAVIAINNVGLFQEVQARNRDLTALGEVGRAVSSTLDLKVVLKAIVGSSWRASHFWWPGSVLACRFGCRTPPRLGCCGEHCACPASTASRSCASA